MPDSQNLEKLNCASSMRISRTRSIRTRSARCSSILTRSRSVLLIKVATPSGAGDQKGTPARQFVGAGTTKLSLQLGLT